MVESPRAVHLRPAGAEDQQIRSPAAPRRFSEQTLRVVRARPFPPIRAAAAVGADLSVPARRWTSTKSPSGYPIAPARRRGCLSSKQLPPQGLEMAAGNPPRGRIDYLTRRLVSRCTVSHYSRRNLSLEVQIFGIKKSADTRKALRFFSERRIRTHFVDLVEKPASARRAAAIRPEVRSDGARRQGIERFDELGLRYAQMSDERWLARLAEEPLLLKLPLVRSGNQVMIGADEASGAMDGLADCRSRLWRASFERAISRFPTLPFKPAYRQ